MKTENNYLKRISNIKSQLTSNVVLKSPVRVLITGAPGNIGYALTFMIAQGSMFGPSQPVILHLFDLPIFADKLKGLKMEVFDGAFPLVKGVVATTDPVEAFTGLDYAIMCGAKPRGKGEERKDLLVNNGKIFEEQGKYFEKYSNKNVKVLVVGNPANTNALVLIKNAPSINPNNFTALTRLDHNRAVSQIAEKLGTNNNEYIQNVTIWGNHSSTQYPNIDFGQLEIGDRSLPLTGVVNDKAWIEGDFLKNVQQRGAKIIEVRGTSSAASAASAACDHMRDWVLGTKGSSWVSMAVFSRGEYGAEKDVVFSFPVTCQNGEWKIVEGLQLSNFAKEKIAATGKELKEEREMALKK